MPRFTGSAEVRLAVEELVDRLGDFLGFSTSRADADEHSVWASVTGQHFIVWTMDSTRAVARVGAGSHIRDRLLASIGVESDDLLTCVYVVCGAVNERLLNEAVGLRRASRQVRLITVDALLALTRLAESGALDARPRRDAAAPSQRAGRCHHRVGVAAASTTVTLRSVSRQAPFQWSVDSSVVVPPVRSMRKTSTSFRPGRNASSGIIVASTVAPRS